MPSPTPLTYNAYVSEIANLAVYQTQTVSGVVQGVDASFNASTPLYVGCVYNSSGSGYWDVIAVS